MGVAEPLRRPTASRGRKRPRAAARLVGTSRAACCRSRLRVNPFLVWFVSLLVVVLWCVGNPDLWDRGLVCFWGTFLLWLVYPNLPIAWAQARARITYSITLKPQTRLASMSWHEHQAGQPALARTPGWPACLGTCLGTSTRLASKPACLGTSTSSMCWDEQTPRTRGTLSLVRSPASPLGTMGHGENHTLNRSHGPNRRPRRKESLTRRLMAVPQAPCRH